MMLERFLQEYSDRDFLFVAPGGNMGDHLIWAGGRKLADSLGLSYSWVRISPRSKVPRLMRNVIIYVHGCGGYKPDSPWIFQLLKRLRWRNPDNLLAVGPSTVELDDEFIEDKLEGIGIDWFFTRDMRSYEFMKKHEGVLADFVYVDEDEAFNLVLGDGYLEKVTRMQPSQLRCDYRLLSLREKDTNVAPVDIDYSQYDVVNPEPFYKSRWARWHYEASSITSNRLHSAVLGSILGKKTFLIKGRWHKQRSVWEYSLRKRGVKWLYC